MSLVLLHDEHMHEGNLERKGHRDLHPKMENGEASFIWTLCFVRGFAAEAPWVEFVLC